MHLKIYEYFSINTLQWINNKSSSNTSNTTLSTGNEATKDVVVAVVFRSANNQQQQVSVNGKQPATTSTTITTFTNWVTKKKAATTTRVRARQSRHFVPISNVLQNKLKAPSQPFNKPNPDSVSTRPYNYSMNVYLEFFFFGVVGAE